MSFWAKARPSARELQGFIEAIYAAGKTLGDDGGEYDLHPAALPMLDGLAMSELAARERVTSTIETGFACGLSGLFLTRALLEVGNPGARHVAIDPFEGHWGDSGLRSFREAGLEKMLEFWREPSQSVLARFSQEKRQFDLGFIDGDHRYDGVFVDLYFMHRVVRPGGWIIVDDMTLPSVACATGFFERNLGYVRDPFNAAAGPSEDEVRHDPRTAVYRRPDEPDTRKWDHFVPFA